jgi:hypothetical protein
MALTIRGTFFKISENMLFSHGVYFSVCIVLIIDRNYLPKHNYTICLSNGDALSSFRYELKLYLLFGRQLCFKWLMSGNLTILFWRSFLPFSFHRRLRLLLALSLHSTKFCLATNVRVLLTRNHSHNYVLVCIFSLKYYNKCKFERILNLLSLKWYTLYS